MMKFRLLSGHWDVQSELSNVHWAARAFVTQDNSPLHCVREFAMRLCPFLIVLSITEHLVLLQAGALGGGRPSLL